MARGQFLQQVEHLVAALRLFHRAADQLLVGRWQGLDGVVVHLTQAQAFGLLEGLLADDVAVQRKLPKALVTLAQLDFAKLVEALKMATVASFVIAQQSPSL